MEEKKSGIVHSISWKGRANGSVTGVTDVRAFDENCVVLETGQGVLTIKGKHLHIEKLFLEQGEVELTGEMDSMVYSGAAPERRGSVLGRIFR